MFRGVGATLQWRTPNVGIKSLRFSIQTPIGVQAFQVAVQATNVHCMGEKAGRHQAPILPLLLSAEPARLPDNTSVPAPIVPQV